MACPPGCDSEPPGAACAWRAWQRLRGPGRYAVRAPGSLRGRGVADRQVTCPPGASPPTPGCRPRPPSPGRRAAGPRGAAGRWSRPGPRRPGRAGCGWRRAPALGHLERLVGLPPGDRAAAAARAGLQDRVQLAHGEQHRPAGEHRGHPADVGDRDEALLDQERQELVRGAARAGAGDRGGRLHDERRVQGALDQDEAAGDPQHGLLGCGTPELVAGDGPDGPLQLLLGDLDDLGGDAGGVGEGEDGGLLADEQHGAGGFVLGVAGGAAGGAVVAARGVLAGEQPVGLFVADLGADVLADVEHARHGWLLLDACAGWFPAPERTTADLWQGSRPRANGIEPPGAEGEYAPGTPHSMSTRGGCTEVGPVSWVTDRVDGRSTNPEIHQSSGCPEIAVTRGNSQLAWNDKALVDTRVIRSLHSNAVCT